MKHNMQILKELAQKNGPLCVGLDTSPSYLPESILKKYSSPAKAVLDFNASLIERIADEKSASSFKVQIAYYEAMGLEGMKTYAETLSLCKKSGLVCISDVKRGDIAATAAAYASAHFSGDFESDIITINPYMGFDTLEPFTKYCTDKGKGIFVLLRTSNPGMVDIEQKELLSGGRVLDAVGNELSRLAEEFSSVFTDCETSPVGAVVGCTEESDARILRDRYKDIFFLIPGYGAQGGAARICATLLDKAGGSVNSSRGILCAWKKDAECLEKEKDQSLTLNDIVASSVKASLSSKTELLQAFASL